MVTGASSLCSAASCPWRPTKASQHTTKSPRDHLSSKILVPNFFGEAYPVLLPTHCWICTRKNPCTCLINETCVFFIFFTFYFLPFLIFTYFQWKKIFQGQSTAMQEAGRRWKVLQATFCSSYKYLYFHSYWPSLYTYTYTDCQPVLMLSKWPRCSTLWPAKPYNWFTRQRRGREPWLRSYTYTYTCTYTYTFTYTFNTLASQAL